MNFKDQLTEKKQALAELDPMLKLRTSALR